MNFTFLNLLVRACASSLQHTHSPVRNTFPREYVSYSCLRPSDSLGLLYNTVRQEETPTSLRIRKQLMPETVIVVPLLPILLLFESGAGRVLASVNMRVDE